MQADKQIGSPAEQLNTTRCKG